MLVVKFIEAISLPAQARGCVRPQIPGEISCPTNITLMLDNPCRIPRAKRLCHRGNLRYTFALAVNFLGNCGVVARVGADGILGTG